jgi:hypothetical protein
LKRNIFITLIIICFFYGCAYNINNKAARDLWVGQPAANFIRVHGEPKYEFTSKNGNKIYVFDSHGENPKEELYIETDSTGKIIYVSRK